MKVPFNNLNIIHSKIHNNVFKRFEKTVINNSFILSEENSEFENKFAKYSNCKYSISCSNGTSALELVLNSLEYINGKDEVLVPVNSFIATSFAISNVNLNPVFYDCDSYYLGDLNDLERKITKKTRAIIGVNLYGQMVNIKKLKSLADSKNIPLIIDGAQSHGANQANSVSEDYSLATTYSFYPGKNLGGWGDGGSINTNNSLLAKKLFMLRNQGGIKKYQHDIVGTNARMSSLQAIVLSEKMKYIEEWIAERNDIAKFYNENLFELQPNLITPKTFEGNYHTNHLYVIQVKNRNKFMGFLKDQGIETGIHYPNLITDNLAYKYHNQYKSKFTNASNFKKKIVSLPIFPGMNKKQLDYVVKNINHFFKK